ncbi:MAG TPA: amidase, partial [Acetobacteraceae bacterium]|nr:amidase [Acetobacteraceae bacterium]
MNTQDSSIAAMGAALRSGTITAEQLARDALARVAARDPALQAFVLVTESRALDDARRADQELRAGRDRGPMHGIP